MDGHYLAKKEPFQLLLCELGIFHIRFTDNDILNILFAPFQCHDLFLYRILRDEAVYRDRVFLAYAVTPIDGLVLDSRVPPGIQEKGIVCLGKIQTQPPCLKGD